MSRKFVSTKRDVFIIDETTGYEIRVPSISMAARILGYQACDIYDYVVGNKSRPHSLAKRKIRIRAVDLCMTSYMG